MNRIMKIKNYLMVSRKKSIKTFFDNEESSQKVKHKISKSCKENLNYVKILDVI